MNYLRSKEVKRVKEKVIYGEHRIYEPDGQNYYGKSKLPEIFYPINIFP